MFPKRDLRVGRVLMYMDEQNSLEFQLRLQQYIELRREGRLLEARQHAQKYIAPHTETHSAEIYTAASMLAFPPDTQAEPYRVVHILHLGLKCANTVHSQCTPHRGGTILLTSSSKRTMNSFRSLPVHFCTLHFRPASQLSRRPLVTQRTQAVAPTQARPQRLSAPSARPS